MENLKNLLAKLEGHRVSSLVGLFETLTTTSFDYESKTKNFKALLVSKYIKINLLRYFSNIKKQASVINSYKSKRKHAWIFQ